MSNEPLIDDMPMMNPHIHGAIILSIPEDQHDTWKTWLDEISLTITHYWKRAVRRQLDKLNISRSITASSQEVQRFHTQTREHLAGWLSYSTKGAILSLIKSLHREDFSSALKPIARIWETVNSTIKGIKLIATSGIVRDALDDAREEAKRLKQDRYERRDREEEPRVTHKYSFTASAYKPVDEWDAEIDKPSSYRTKLFQRYYKDSLLPTPEEINAVMAKQRQQAERARQIREQQQVLFIV